MRLGSLEAEEDALILKLKDLNMEESIKDHGLGRDHKTYII